MAEGPEQVTGQEVLQPVQAFTELLALLQYALLMWFHAHLSLSPSRAHPNGGMGRHRYTRLKVTAQVHELAAQDSAP